MKLLKNHIIHKDGSGSVELMPEEPEDMWHAYNLIRPGDVVRASAMRRVTTSQSATGATASTRVQVKLSIKVTGSDFDPAAGQLHVSGTVCEQNAHVAMGAYHTLDLELVRPFSLEKANGWDSVALDILRESVKTDNKAHLWAVVMQEGLANICQITQYQTVFRQAVRQNVPHKRSGASDHEKAMARFHATLLETLLRQIDFSSSDGPGNTKPPLLIASPAFYANNFVKYMKEEASRTTNKPLLAYIPSIITAHSASGHMSALQDALSSPAVTAKLADTKYARETDLINRFYELMRADDLRAWYGPREVERAVARGGVGRGGGVLLISDALFRSLDVAVRRRWVALVDRVRDVEGGEVRVLSSAHESGKRLEALGGIAAILTFPMPDLDEDSESEQDGDDNVAAGDAEAVGEAEQGVRGMQI